MKIIKKKAYHELMHRQFELTVKLQALRFHRKNC